MNEKPLVSILAPSYNHESYIDDFMQSLIEQTYGEIEILILDDCSKDHNFEKILAWKERLKGKFKFVYIERNETNLGVTRTLNKLLRICQGKYIKPLATDDFLFPDSIEKLVRYYEEHQDCGLIFANGISGDQDTHYPIEDKKTHKPYYVNIPDLSGNLVEKLYRDNFIFAPAGMFNRGTYQKIGEFDEEIEIEDWDYYLRVAKEMPIGYLAETVIMYRCTATSMTQSCSLESRIRMRRSELQILDKHKENVDDHVSRHLISIRCNEIFKEAFDMRSRAYVDAIFEYMKRKRIALKGANVVWLIIYKSHLADKFFKSAEDGKRM